MTVNVDEWLENGLDDACDNVTLQKFTMAQQSH